MLKVGDIAPQFNLPNQDGEKIQLSDLLGRKIVLYFYQKDDSPKCTKQACSFRDNYKEFEKKNIIIIGISFDNKKSHKQFIDRFNLPYQLLSDIDTKVATEYGVYGEKMLYGRKFMGIHRTTFIIDEHGKIQYIFKKVNPTTHASDILKKIT